MATNELSLEHFLKPIGENPKELPLEAFITGSTDSAESFHEPTKVEATGGSPIFNLPSKRDIPGGDFETSLEVTASQMKNFETVKRENAKREEKIRAMDTIYPGLWAEYQEYQANEGGVGFFAKAGRRMNKLVTRVFNLLQMPSWGIGASIDEAVKTGNVWDSYTAFVGEYLDGIGMNKVGYKPKNVDILGLFTKYGLLDPKARPITKAQIKKASKIGITAQDLEDWEAEAVTSSEVQAWVTGLLATIFIDPLNKAPANLAEVPGKLYTLGKKLVQGNQ